MKKAIIAIPSRNYGLPNCKDRLPTSKFLSAGGLPSFRGFTLIEVLVVITIIGVLATLLFSLLRRTIASAEEAKCMNNLKQISIAANLYSSDHNGDIPPSRLGSQQPGGGAGSATTYWPWLLATQLGSGYPTAKPYRLDTPFVCKSAHKWKSSAAKGFAEYAGGSPAQGIVSTYSVNAGFAPALDKANWQGTQRKLNGVPNPAATSYFTDGYGQAFVYSYYSAISFIYPHNGKLHVLFFDGHVEARTKNRIPTDRADVFYDGDVLTYTP